MHFPEIIGLVIGLVFGGLFTWLHRRGIRTTRGTLTRVAVLMIALVAVRLLLPVANPGWITGGLFMGLFVPMAWLLRRVAHSR